MSERYRSRKLHWVMVVAMIGLVAGGVMWAQPAAADDLEKTSLKLVPENAAFYSSMLHNREQFEAIANSRAWAKIMAMPIVQMGLQQYQKEADKPGSVPNIIEGARQHPDVKKLIDLAVDMASQEVFIYGDASCIQFVDLVQQLVGAVRYGPMLAQLSGRARGISPNQLMPMMLLATLSENADLLKVPDMVIGFKLANRAAAEEQLKKLEKEAGGILDQLPQFQGRFKRTMVGKHEYLVLSLDGKMIPWDELPVNELRRLEAEKGDAAKVIDRLKKATLVVALGVRDEYLLVAFGSSTDCLARLGTGRTLLERAEFKPLQKHADKRLTSVSYISKPMVARLTTTKKDIDDLLDVVNEVLPLAGLPEELATRIGKDAAALARDLKGLMAEPGATMAFSFLVEKGMESYSYNWGEHGSLDGSKPLGLLQHVGGNPLLAVVGRSKVSTTGYDLLVKWFNVGYGYFTDLAVPSMNPREKGEFEKFIKQAKPLLKRFDTANRDMLLPALADGQAALVIDARLQSRQFIKALPATERPMPMIEPALLVGVSDADLLRKAFAEYREVINGFIDVISQQVGEPPPFKLPEPKVSEGRSGTIFGYPLPQMWGVDEQIVPNFGLSKAVGVLAITRDHTERLLSPTPLAYGGVLATTDRALAGAAVCNFAGLIDAATPWIDLAAQQIMKEQRVPEAAQAGIVAQVHTVLEVLKVLRYVTSEDYFEDGALVNHTLVEIRDIKD